MAPWINGLIAVSTASRTISSYDLAVQNVSISSIDKVRSNLVNIASASWELGTATEALLELSWPSLSVFHPNALPPSPVLNATTTPTEVLEIANRIVSQRPADSLTLIANQGSAADPASIGVSVLLANWTRTQVSDLKYAEAAVNELTYVLDYAPRSETGAISHRTDQVQLWADFMYMVPPFIAYYGGLKGGIVGRALLQVAYEQCRLYRDALRDDSGLWRHITQGSYEDKKHWATGNGWAAAGMLRVLATLNHTSYGIQFASEQANLINWIDEILQASWAHQNANGTLLNVIDDPSSFGDTSATALLASVTYRMAVFKNDNSLIPFAEKALLLVNGNIDSDGWLQNTVNPVTFYEPLPPGEHSPEGQAFVLLLESARRDFSAFVTQSASKPRTTGTTRPLP